MKPSRIYVNLAEKHTKNSHLVPPMSQIIDISEYKTRKLEKIMTKIFGQLIPNKIQYSTGR